MEWKRDKPKPQLPGSKLNCGPISLHVSSEPEGNRWQHMHMSFGEFSDEPFADCLETWPVRVIALAHEALNKLERELQEQDNETTLEGREADSRAT